MERSKLYEYAVIYHPPKKKHDDGTLVAPDAVLIVELTTKLARRPEDIAVLASRAIPEEHLKHLEDIEIIVRPFN